MSNRVLRIARLVGMVAIAACSNGEADHFSGHQIGIDYSDRYLDLCRYRVEVARMHSVRKHPIPNTRFVLLGWSPEGHWREMEKRNL